jgi:peroxiredoxin Q/BCP
MLEFYNKCGFTLVNHRFYIYNKIRNIQLVLEIAMPIASGIQAPDFNLQDENNITRRLSDFRGRTVVLYFYPKDDTPGCTTEACNFRDDYSAYVNADVVILGVSPDDCKSHAKFKEKFTLQFLLLADNDHEVCSQYGVWGPKKFMGREYEGVLRTTYLVDANGRIAKVFENVKPAEHSQEVLAAIKLL